VGAFEAERLFRGEGGWVLRMGGGGESGKATKRAKGGHGPLLEGGDEKGVDEV
jgi:hypothetical protein